jgi:hypothetical protein
MRIVIQNDNASPDRLVRRALYLLFKAGVYSAEGGGSINAPAVLALPQDRSYEEDQSPI